MCLVYAGLAQMGERYPYKVDVAGSIPASCTIINKYSRELTTTLYMLRVVQLVETLDCGSRCCGFDSHLSTHIR